MRRLKEKILEDNQIPTPSSFSSTCDPTPSTSSSTCDPTPSMPSHTTRSNDTYGYGVGIFAVLAIGVCVFLHIRLKIKNKRMIARWLSMSKKRITHQKDVICFSKIYAING